MTDKTTNEPQHQVIFMPSGRRGRVAEGTDVLSAARQLGVEIESLCGGRITCNKCRIRVEDGNFAKHNITSQANHLSDMHLCLVPILIDAQIFSYLYF